MCSSILNQCKQKLKLNALLKLLLEIGATFSNISKIVMKNIRLNAQRLIHETIRLCSMRSASIRLMNASIKPNIRDWCGDDCFFLLKHPQLIKEAEWQYLIDPVTSSSTCAHDSSTSWFQFKLCVIVKLIVWPHVVATHTHTAIYLSHGKANMSGHFGV